MTDSDYIRAAVELAEGWTAEPSRICVNNAVFYIDLADGQWVIDALAAQLVRQVDAAPKIHFESGGVGQVNVWRESEPWNRRTHAEGPDRTMNTIKAIVDSGVLG